MKYFLKNLSPCVIPTYNLILISEELLSVGMTAVRLFDSEGFSAHRNENLGYWLQALSLPQRTNIFKFNPHFVFV